jgi:hypothetical protein
MHSGIMSGHLAWMLPALSLAQQLQHTSKRAATSMDSPAWAWCDSSPVKIIHRGHRHHSTRQRSLVAHC